MIFGTGAKRIRKTAKTTNSTKIYIKNINKKQKRKDRNETQ